MSQQVLQQDFSTCDNLQAKHYDIRSSPHALPSIITPLVLEPEQAETVLLLEVKQAGAL